MDTDPFQVAAGLPADVKAAAAALAYEHETYFITEKATETLPVSSLRLCRKRPDGIASAVIRMAEAAKGLRSRRSPIRVKAREDGGYEVIDGNSTVTIAAAAGWPGLPCSVEVNAKPT